MTRWRNWIAGVALAVTLAVAPFATGCAAPTLPLPPPTALVSAPDATGFVTVSGHADSRAYVFVLHEESETGVIVHAATDGTFSVRLPANLGDTISVWQMVGNDTGQQAHFTVMP